MHLNELKDEVPVKIPKDLAYFADLLPEKFTERSHADQQQSVKELLGLYDNPEKTKSNFSPIEETKSGFKLAESDFIWEDDLEANKAEKNSVIFKDN
jgi:hypothetical protein